MVKEILGNRITDNAFDADDGKRLIERALSEIAQTGWNLVNEKPLFSGVYYDSAKVGSFIAKVIHKEHGSTAVLKIQLRPLPYDEGFIVRHIAVVNKSSRIILPFIIHDEAWDEERGYGFLLFEDLSHLPNLWTVTPLAQEERLQHKDFLKEFFGNFLPVTPFLRKPDGDFKVKVKDSFEHFKRIADASSYRRVPESELLRMSDMYFAALETFDSMDLHFTHAHLSGRDVKYDEKNDRYIVMANLYWSWRQDYQELAFPMWVEMMNIRERSFEVQRLLGIIAQWNELWKDNLFDHDPTETRQYWFNLLERSMLTAMLDLGSSEWQDNEVIEKQFLLDAWKGLFYWIAENKFVL